MPVTRNQLKRQKPSKNRTDSKSSSASGGRRIEPSNKRVKRVTERYEVTLIRSLPEENWIGGLTTLDKELYVFYNKWTDVAVYDTDTYDFRRRLSVPGLGGVNDMTSCQQYRCIYLSDPINKVIHKIIVKTTDNTFDELTDWNVGDAPFGLSVNGDHDVIATCFDVNKVKIFNTFGELLKVIALADMIHPLHTMQLTTGKFVVSHGASVLAKDDPVERVCLVDGNGNLEQSFGSSPGSDENHVHVAARLAVINSFILVADFHNHRVLMLSPTLRYVQTAVKELRGCPNRMWYDDKTGRLYLADNKHENGAFSTGHVNVYNVAN